ncbi:MAG TPA: hypothetical protein VI756_17345 [Blastocatellia bacterium]
MNILELVYHRHYWSLPHRGEGNRIIQTCYDCGKDRESAVKIDGVRQSAYSPMVEPHIRLRVPPGETVTDQIGQATT